MGDVGSGKSTLVEKVTGLKGRSSASSSSVTKKASYSLSTDNSFVVTDTPGVNVTSDKFAQNVWIAQALNLRPVSQILITVKADTRMENVIGRVKDYMLKLSALGEKEAISLVVTHMDNRDLNWTEEDFCAELVKERIAITNPIFTGNNINRPVLLKKMHEKCKDKDGNTKHFNINIDSDNFNKVFRTSQHERRGHDAIVKEKERMALGSRSFFEVFDTMDQENDKMDLLCEFQGWAVSEMIEAQKRVEEVVNEEGTKDAAETMQRLIFLKDVLEGELLQVKEKVDEYNKKHGNSQFRKCPHCGTIWSLAEGCEGLTICGEMVFGRDERDSGSMATFKFEWELKDNIPQRLQITRTNSISKPMGKFTHTANTTDPDPSQTQTPDSEEGSLPGNSAWTMPIPGTNWRLGLSRSPVSDEITNDVITVPQRKRQNEERTVQSGRLQGRRGCGAQIEWARMASLTPQEIPDGMSWAVEDVENDPALVKDFKTKYNDLTSNLKPRFDAGTLGDEETITFYVIPKETKYLDDLNEKIRNIHIDGVSVDGAKEVPYQNPKITKQLKVQVKIKDAKLKKPLYEEVDEIRHVRIIENLTFEKEDEEEEEDKEIHTGNDGK